MGRVRWVVPLARIPHLTPTLSAPRGGEGDFKFSAYRFQYPLNVFHHIPVPEPDHAIASPGDFPAPCFICIRRIRVLPTIELYDELRGRTCEVDNVFADRVLTAKAVRKREFAQLAPQSPLGFRHVPPQAPGERRSSHSISIRMAPYSTGCASATKICATRPGRWARIWFITFIASMISRGCPSATESPRRTKGGSPGCGAR